MKKKTVRIAIFKPGEPVTFESVTDSLETYQKLVGGYIELVYLSDRLALFANEEGKLQGLPGNRTVSDATGIMFDTIAGTFIVFRPQGSAVGSLQPQDEEQLMRWTPGTVWRIGAAEPIVTEGHHRTSGKPKA